MRIDLHCHSKYSGDNDLEPGALIEQALRCRLDAVCFTEHHSIEASLPVERIKLPEGFFVFRGVEIATDHGHLLVFGLPDDRWNRWQRSIYLDLFAVTKEVHDRGGICIPAHPFRGWDSLGEHIMHKDAFDAIETHNGANRPEDNEKAAEITAAIGLPAVGGSDCHHREEVGSAFTIFNNNVQTLAALVEEIKKGNCRGAIGGQSGTGSHFNSWGWFTLAD
jgi:hypothetical protein